MWKPNKSTACAEGYLNPENTRRMCQNFVFGGGKYRAVIEIQTAVDKYVASDLGQYSSPKIKMYISNQISISNHDNMRFSCCASQS